MSTLRKSLVQDQMSKSALSSSSSLSSLSDQFQSVHEDQDVSLASHVSEEEQILNDIEDPSNTIQDQNSSIHRLSSNSLLSGHPISSSSSSSSFKPRSPPLASSSFPSSIQPIISSLPLSSLMPATSQAPISKLQSHLYSINNPQHPGRLLPPISPMPASSQLLGLSSSDLPGSSASGPSSSGTTNTLAALQESARLWRELQRTQVELRALREELETITGLRSSLPAHYLKRAAAICNVLIGGWVFLSRMLQMFRAHISLKSIFRSQLAELNRRALGRMSGLLSAATNGTSDIITSRLIPPTASSSSSGNPNGPPPPHPDMPRGILSPVSLVGIGDQDLLSALLFGAYAFAAARASPFLLAAYLLLEPYSAHTSWKTTFSTLLGAGTSTYMALRSKKAPLLHWINAAVNLSALLVPLADNIIFGIVSFPRPNSD